VYVQELQGKLFVSVPARNEGVGIALDATGTFVWRVGQVEGEVTVRQVSPHEFTRASFLFPAADSVPTFATVTAAGHFSVVFRYSDLAGNKWASRLALVPGAPDWTVFDCQIWGEGRV
jgi:hypothetical protein